MKEVPLKAKILIGNFLRCGLLLSLTIALFGALLFFWQHPDNVYNYQIFHGEPLFLKNIPTMLKAALSLESTAIMQLGALVLIATPAFRVLACLVIFAWQRDFLYVFLSLIVLAILLYSFFWQTDYV